MSYGDARPDTTGVPIIYGIADVADLLTVTRPAVTNYRMRHADAPSPSFVTLDGRPFWDEQGMRAWVEWSDSRNSSTAQRSTAIANLRAKLTEK